MGVRGVGCAAGGNEAALIYPWGQLKIQGILLKQLFWKTLGFLNNQRVYFEAYICKQGDQRLYFT